MSIEPLWGIELGYKLIFFRKYSPFSWQAPKIPEISLVEHRQDDRRFTHLDHFVTRRLNVNYVIVLGTFVLKGLAQAKIIKKSVILFRLLNMTI